MKSFASTERPQKALSGLSLRQIANDRFQALQFWKRAKVCMHQLTSPAGSTFLDTSRLTFLIRLTSVWSTGHNHVSRCEKLHLGLLQAEFGASAVCDNCRRHSKIT
jgi:hypothetical protein